MTNGQTVHIGMINSYRLLTGKVTFQQVIMSGVGMFAHIPDEDITSSELDYMITYFQELEMFEHCAELLDYRKNNFNKNGTYKHEECKCELPDIKEYSLKVECSICNKRLIR